MESQASILIRALGVGEIVLAVAAEQFRVARRDDGKGSHRPSKSAPAILRFEILYVAYKNAWYNANNRISK
jgi:hypothetical protein